MVNDRPSMTSNLHYNLFADESGVHATSRCYGIGCLAVTDVQLDELSTYVATEKAARHFTGELKWSELRTYRQSIDIARNIIQYILKAKLPFRAIIVRKETYTNWHLDKERAFYVTYYQLIRSMAKNVKTDDFQIFIDDRSDSYNKQHEVLEIITNHSLAAEHFNKLVKVTKLNSEPSLALQCVDILIGAITSSTNLYLNAGQQLHAGKIEVIRYFAQLLDWDVLHYDTYPNASPINIWHFPKDFRATPATKAVNLRV